MRALRHIRENPIIILAVAIFALFTWIGYDLVASRKTQSKNWATIDEQRAGLPEAVVDGVVADTILDPVALPTTRRLPNRVAPVTTAVLPKLKPGMKRVEVEGLLGPPSADRVHPVVVNDGRVTYRTAYELADPDPVMTIRPIGPRPRIPPPSANQPPSLIALEYDASQPGHPLVEIVYADPLF